MRKPAALLIFILITSFSHAQNDIKVSLSRDSISVGELSVFQWQLSLPTGTKVLQMPMLPDSMPSGIEVVKKKDIITEKKDRTIYTNNNYRSLHTTVDTSLFPRCQRFS